MATSSSAQLPRLFALSVVDPLKSAELARALDCPSLIARLLILRGHDSPQAASRFLNPTIAGLANPMQMLGMASAVERIQRAIDDREAILIYGDYDVDGTTATVLLKVAIERAAAMLGAARPDVRYHVPHRLREGYGMQAAELTKAQASGVRLVISVDTGIRAFAAAATAKELALDLIVTDHHLADELNGVPDALAVLNPNQPGCPYPSKSLCGAAVAFKLAHALLSVSARTEEARLQLDTRLLPSLLKLVAIATIADSVPLTGENRTIAVLGLRELATPVQPGLRALMAVASIPSDRPPTATEIGFRLAPRINAAGRMDVASDVVELFLTRDPEVARQLAEKLDGLNEARRQTEAQALEAILLQLEAQATPVDSTAEISTAEASAPATFKPGPQDCLVLDDEAWHRGVLGILASRVVERTGRPALVLTHEDGHAHGSGRSIEGFHLLDALTAVDLYHHVEHPAASAPLFTRFGGHAHAVGFSLPSHRLDDLRERLKHYAGTRPAPPTAPASVHCEAEVALADLTPALFYWLERLAPFGQGHPEPVLLTRRAIVAEAPRTIKQKHLCLRLHASDLEASRALKAIGWSRQLDWLAEAERLELKAGTELDIAFHLRLNTHAQYGGVELELLHISLADDNAFIDDDKTFIDQAKQNHP